MLLDHILLTLIIRAAKSFSKKAGIAELFSKNLKTGASLRKNLKLKLFKEKIKIDDTIQ